METTPDASSSSSGLRLRRSLTLWDLILYGIIVIQPTAPMPAYGVFSNAGAGPRGDFDSDRHDRHGVHRHELRTHGAGLSQRGFGLHLCGPRDSSLAGLRHRLEHDHGLHAQSLDLHHLVLQGDGRSADWDAISDSVSRPAVAGDFCAAVYRAEPARASRLRPGSIRPCAPSWER